MFDSRLLFRVFSAISLSRLRVSCVRGGSGTSARRFHFGAVFCALVCALVLAGATAPAAWGQTTIYVDHAATGANDGSSWADAYTSLQDALDAASGSDEIYIAQGTYYPDEGQTVTDDERSASFTITGTQDGLKVYGGFEAGDAFADRSPADHPVLLSGDIDQDNASAGNSYHVVVMDGGDGIGENIDANITNATELNGVTITGGNANEGFAQNARCCPCLFRARRAAGCKVRATAGRAPRHRRRTDRHARQSKRPQHAGRSREVIALEGAVWMLSPGLRL